ncbi:cytochrome C oxidase subunit IV family protein [Nitrospirillum sp. BR 11164]|uniref:cytochrome C oxidase subunit IV family protein n=1 Tax=Nitrospirillum sp. BR 11164 TaxID=3104324 RepID=UPI002AFE488C|nr:cytochrome C oxidase subunit IV family protein [Nitrospirillum sp. BR 11164]MEA1648233.1 cytochrome C oxidase subunit IV family protein [Nitrospirillum sp. BR 11164]
MAYPRLWPLLAVWAALLALLGLTVGASLVLTGTPSLVASLGIATAKAALIAWVYMRLRREGGLLRIMALGAAFWLLILLGYLALDYLTR